MNQQKGNTVIIIAIILALATLSVVVMVNRNKLSKRTPAITQEAPQTDKTYSLQPSTTSLAVTPASEKSLDQDFAAVEGKMQTLDTQLKDIDTGLNDKMGDLSE